MWKKGHRPHGDTRDNIQHIQIPPPHQTHTRSRSRFFNRLAEGDLVGALQDGDAVGNERVAQDVARPRDAEGFGEGGDFLVLGAGRNDPAAAGQRSQP